MVGCLSFRLTISSMRSHWFCYLSWLRVSPGSWHRPFEWMIKRIQCLSDMFLMDQCESSPLELQLPLGYTKKEKVWENKDWGLFFSHAAQLYGFFMLFPDFLSSSSYFLYLSHTPQKQVELEMLQQSLHVDLNNKMRNND